MPLSKSDWNAECDRCGLQYKASKLVLEWTGLRICKTCFESRHEQLSVRSVPDNQAVPRISRKPELYITGEYCDTSYNDVAYTGIN